MFEPDRYQGRAAWLAIREVESENPNTLPSDLGVALLALGDRAAGTSDLYGRP